MAKKIKNNPYGMVTPGFKKQMYKDVMRQLPKDFEKEYERRLNEEVKKVRFDYKTQLNKDISKFVGDFILAFAWSLRNNHGYGKKRIEKAIQEIFDVVSDAKMQEVGYFLFDMKEINEQLLEEINLDVEKLILENLKKHLDRAEVVVNEKLQR